MSYGMPKWPTWVLGVCEEAGIAQMKFARAYLQIEGPDSRTRLCSQAVVLYFSLTRTSHSILFGYKTSPNFFQGHIGEMLD
jgi:hypothetical protein